MKNKGSIIIKINVLNKGDFPMYYIIWAKFTFSTSGQSSKKLHLKRTGAASR